MSVSPTKQVVKNLQLVQAKIAALSKELKLPQQPVLVAVSKKKPVSFIKACFDEGQLHFGENYVSELVEKAPQLPAGIRWHFIGHLQSNKCKLLASIPNLYMVETIDSPKLADKLNKACQEAGRKDRLKVLLQVNTSGEASKSGFEPTECQSVLEHVRAKCPLLECAGLMTIGALDDTPHDADFKVLNECKAKLLAAKIKLDPWIMSMGMSADYELAIRCGSTNVRVGSTIFGEREPKPETPANKDATASPTEQLSNVSIS